MLPHLLPPSHMPRILVVEDEMLVARDICAQLQLMGYAVVAHTPSGEAALQLAQQHQPDLVLMDIQLTGALDGIAVAQALHATLATPVVFLTAFDADDILARAKLAEPYGYLLKPFSERELHNVLEMALYKCQAEARLRDAARRSQAVLDAMHDGVVCINPQGQVESSNPAACHMFGYSADQLQGLPLQQLMPAAAQNEHLADLTPEFASRQPGPVEGVRQDGSVFPLSVAMSQLQEAGQRTLVAVLHDLSSQTHSQQALHRLAFYDQLTGLTNRAGFKERLLQATVRAQQSHSHVALMLLDLDNFKTINDTHGLAIGDQVLIDAGRRMQAILRTSDTVARMSGDEFAVLMENLSPNPHEAGARAQACAQALLQALAQEDPLHPHPLQASVGVVLFNGTPSSVDELLSKAHIAMVEAKSAGRHTVRFFDVAMQTALLAQAQRLTDLTRAVVQQEFVLYYQPQVNGQGQLLGAEALLRWQHPQRGLVAPGEFIALAEDSQLILPLGQWVLEQACAQVSAWAADAATAHWVVAINVSALQFAQPDFVAQVQAALQHSGTNPQRIELELTESMLVSDVAGVIAKMQQLKALGVKFSLDDFGTGYSSLSYLKRLPLDQLKIDQSFVRDLMLQASDTAIVRAVIAMGHSLGLRVIAEGVETPEQRDILAGLQCDAFQGYYFGRPMPAAALVKWHHEFYD
ncbi:EAL domain-containing protein [Rhodoferax sp.]|uniref:putative bifunctional diguanylate cyclase/phosphodiesterase n=1 Tax=Rhodoferax sp. TaxID=50421 RepID=UPI002605FC23|nr:EAL domain-containing protein [Rhodoferax sp.]MDD5479046.1 EAL domain-containing protein [Rhodoferax sp.]